MIKRYKEFINESIFNEDELEFLLEANIILTDELSLIIDDMDSEIAGIISTMSNKDYETNSNYFDITKSSDKVSFTTTSRENRIKETEHVWQAQYDKTNDDAILSEFTIIGNDTNRRNISYSDLKILDTKKINGVEYVLVSDLRGEQGVFNKEHMRFDNNNIFKDAKNRQEIKVGKLFRGLLSRNNIAFTDSQIEEFVNEFKVKMDFINKKDEFFKIVTGDDITDFYNSSNYVYAHKGQLGSSCMSDSPNYYFDIYIKNEQVCSLLILRYPLNTELILGRALLWTLSDGKKFLDRVYTNFDSDIELFREYALNQGYYVKEYNDSNESDSHYSPITREVEKMGSKEIDIIRGAYEGYPYLDTFKHWDSNGTLSCVSGNDTVLLENTEGYAGCEECNGESVTCDTCDGNTTLECNTCNGDGELYCDTCLGSGNMSCYVCDEVGQVDCETCGGSGEEDGEDCEDCDGGQVDCRNCDGEGESSCEDCSNGTVECEDCDGDGGVGCEDCDGEGEQRCNNCN